MRVSKAAFSFVRSLPAVARRHRLALLSAVAVVATLLVPLGEPSTLLGSTVSPVLTSPAAGTIPLDPTPVNGDGFWFSGGVEATLLNRVVRMAPDTPAAVRTLVAEVVRQINDASGAGVTIGADTTGPPTTTEIVVRAPTTTVCGPNAAGCASNAVASVDGYGVVVNALVEIDRDLLGSGYELPILLHEMGHAMGLGHYDQPYDGRMQIMWNSVTTDMTSYRSGDRNGLAALGATFSNRNVTGTIDSVDLTPGGLRLRGWALDLDAPELSLAIGVTIDGIEVAGVADASRPDVGAVYPAAGSNHGVDLVIPTAGLEGNHTLCLVATGWRGQDVGIGCRATTVTHTSLGNLERARQVGPGRLLIGGWALDPDSAVASPVEITVDGAVVATTTTNLARSDVNAVYPEYPGPRGWAVEVDGISPGTHRVCARARDLTGDPDRVIGCRSVAVRGGNPFGNVDALAPSATSPLRLVGWAIDPDTAESIDIHLYIDGRFSRAAAANRFRPDVGRDYPGYGDDHGFSVALPGLAPGRHSVCAFAINRSTGDANTYLGCRDINVASASPFGSVDAVTIRDDRPVMLGWTIDPNTVDPIGVHLWVDGRWFTAATANRSRPDVGRAYPAFGSGHGFVIPLDGLGDGTHSVCAYGINPGTAGPNPLLGCRSVRIG